MAVTLTALTLLVARKRKRRRTMDILKEIDKTLGDKPISAASALESLTAAKAYIRTAKPKRKRRAKAKRVATPKHKRHLAAKRAAKTRAENKEIRTKAARKAVRTKREKKERYAKAARKAKRTRAKSKHTSRRKHGKK
jgi:hypothetical protein